MGAFMALNVNFHDVEKY